MAYHTKIGSLENFEKGTIEVNDDLKQYAFSNLFEVANNSKPFERVAVVKNLEYTWEVSRVEGESPWYTAPHDEFAIVMDGEVEFTFIKLDEDALPSNDAGAVQLSAAPNGQRMGRIKARKGHEVLLPKGAAYQLKSSKSAVALYQTLEGPETIERWSEICTLS